jgi:phage shock protein C
MSTQNWLQNFTRSRKDRWIGGVCGGLGEQTPVPSWTWRLIFTLFLLIWGTGLLLYILLWIFVPETPKSDDTQPSA